MQIISLIYVMMGGAIGSMLRYIAVTLIFRLSSSDFPYGTLFVNVFGSFLMGLWIGLIAGWLPERSRDLHLIFAVGVLGGFTTFSTFTLDAYSLYENHAYVQAILYIFGSVALSLVGLVSGMFLVKVVS